MSSLTPTAEEVYKTFRKLMEGGTSRYPIGNWGNFQEGIDELLDEGILEFIERDNGLVSYYRFTEDIINTILKELTEPRTEPIGCFFKPRQQSVMNVEKTVSSTISVSPSPENWLPPLDGPSVNESAVPYSAEPYVSNPSPKETNSNDT